jgi:hypothetical protein
MTNAQAPIYLSEVKLKRLRSKGAVQPAGLYNGSLKALSSEYVDISHEDYLNENELKSVSALICYVAHDRKADQSSISADVTKRFGVSGLDQLRRQSYEEIIRFLVDMCVEEVLD